MRGRKPLNQNAAMAKGVDHLLREFKALRRSDAAASSAGTGTTGSGPIEPTILVASYEARPEIQAVADFVCDGTADEEELQAAIDIVDALDRNGTVVLTEGFFFLEDYISLSTHVNLVGQGVHQTILDADANAPTARNGLVIGGYGTGIIRDLSITCGNTNFKTCLYVDASDYGVVENVELQMTATASPAYAAAYIGDGTTVNNVHVTSANTTDGLYLDNNVQVINCRIDSATTDGDGTGYGMLTSALAKPEGSIIGCHISGCATGAINLPYGNEWRIIGNHAEDGIVLGASSTNNIVVHNIGAVTDSGTGNTTTNIKHDNFNEAGALSVGSGTIRYYTQTDRTITGCYAMVSGAPSGSAAIFDVNIDGTTAYTTQGNRPTVAAAGYLSTVTVPDVTAWDTGSYLTIDVDAANSATDLILVVEYTEA